MLDTIKNAWRISDLRRKILYTFMIILVFRVGSNIPVPFINREYLAMALGGAEYMGFLNVLTGGALMNAALFALGISPYITASIILQLLTVAIPALERIAKEGPEGRKKLNKITRYATAGLAIVQAIAFYIMNRNFGAVTLTASALENLFIGVVIVMSFAAGAMLIVWLGESIDKRGVGNGISIILFAGIVSSGPAAFNYLLWLFNTGRYIAMAAIVIIFLFLIFAIVLMTNAERRIPVQYAKRVVGRKMYGGQSSYMPIKVMMSGVMPIIFASALLSLPTMVRDFAGMTALSNPIAFTILSFFDHTSISFAIMFFGLIIAFNFFYVAMQYNPVEMANNLRKNSGTVPGIRPGKPTSDFIGRVISKITLVGALFLGGVAILPIILGVAANLQIALGGTSIIIVVGVALDTVKQLESQMMMRHYKGFLE